MAQDLEKDIKLYMVLDSNKRAINGESFAKYPKQNKFPSQQLGYYGIGYEDKYYRIYDEQRLMKHLLNGQYISYKYIAEVIICGDKNTKKGHSNDIIYANSIEILDMYELWSDNLICNRLIQKNGDFLENVPKNKQSIQMCTTAIKQKKYLIKYANPEFITIEIAMACIDCDISFTQYMPHKYHNEQSFVDRVAKNLKTHFMAIHPNYENIFNDEDFIHKRKKE